MKRNSKAPTNRKASTKNYSKSKSRRNVRRDTTDAAAAAQESTNDPAWYSASPELLRDSSSIPFSWPAGAPMKTGSYMAIDTTPGVIAIDVEQAVGTTNDRHDPVNVAGDAIYSFVRHANSGHANYDAPDLMMYLIGMSSIYSFITWCQRLLGLIMTYDQRNRYLPDVLINMNRVSAVQLRSKISDFRFWLNTYINKVASFAIPAVMPYFQRMAFLYANYYIDGPSIKDQFYMYTPRDNKWLKFSIDPDTSLGKLTPTAMTMAGSIATVEEIITYGEDLFSSMWNQEDFGIMSGDILKAYGDNIIKLAPVPELLMLQPTYDVMFLHQFKNAKHMFGSRSYVGPIFVNGDGYIQQTVSTTNGSAIAGVFDQLAYSNVIISSDFDNPTPEVVMESTRLMPAIDVGSNGVNMLHVASEVPCQIRIGFINIHGGVQISAVNSVGEIADAFPAAPLLMNFKYAPEFISGTINDGSYATAAAYRLWDIDNYACLSNEDLNKMHQAALMNLLAVPSIAKIQ